MLAAFSCEKPDHVPCCFLLFQVLQRRSSNDFDFFDRQRELGLDVRVELPDISMPIESEVSVTTRKEEPEGERVAVLRRISCGTRPS